MQCNVDMKLWHKVVWCLCIIDWLSCWCIDWSQNSYKHKRNTLWDCMIPALDSFIVCQLSSTDYYHCFLKAWESVSWNGLLVSGMQSWILMRWGFQVKSKSIHFKIAFLLLFKVDSKWNRKLFFWHWKCMPRHPNMQTFFFFYIFLFDTRWMLLAKQSIWISNWIKPW